ncbi:HlyD family efflux transporter periplasmic adaptor subunit [Pseudomonas sp. NPDC007930]|uniref:HlyD family secretion protein n=1 Tax=Pseudomonas sp. NPDC007930 TaxID=3364417 RepID=UPI0036E1A247
MKIRFNSPKESHPTQDSGLQVLYAPGKRLAFKLRWYFILFLILLPALWLAGRYGLDLIRIEAPALVRLQVLEIRARQAGRIQAIHVQAGDHVNTGKALVELDNPEWDLRLAILNGSQAAPAPGSNLAALDQRALGTLQALVGRAQQRVSEVRRMYNDNAATRGELVDAQNALDNRQAELLQFQRAQLGGAGTSEAARYAQQQEAERKWLQGQMASLNVAAPYDGRVAEVIAAEGENVGPGTPLLRLEKTGPAQLWIYLDPKDVDHSAPGSKLEVRLPDGSWASATVISPAESANPLPTDLRQPFSSPARGLLVPAQFDQPLAAEWRVDSLPVRVRFPGERFHIFGWEI